VLPVLIFETGGSFGRLDGQFFNFNALRASLNREKKLNVLNYFRLSSNNTTLKRFELL
jgi:hypothetical protein